MNCDETREWLLEGDPAGIQSDSAPFATHLRTCADCAAFARRILDHHARLVAALDRVERSYTPRLHPRRGLRAATFSTLAAAAAVAGVMIIGRVNGDPLAPPPDELYAALNPPRPFVETPAGVRAAVIRTDRDLTLVLLYDEETDQ